MKSFFKNVKIKIYPLDWVCYDTDSNPLTPDICVFKCGNGYVETDEKWDDSNLFDYDGCDSNWVVEPGFICIEGSLTTPTKWVENEFMPDATLTVLQTNDLLIRFNDTISETTISNNDLNIRIYGSSLYYVFNWTAEYMDKSSVQVYMNIQSKIYGGESILVDFVNTNKFKSVYSKRGVNPKELAGKLFENKGSESSSDSLGQTAMILFLFSLFIALISSFGGNSMEMTWNLMNTLQLLFYLSYVYVNFPEHLSQFFGYLKYANAENQYLSSLTFWIVSRDNFKRGHVSVKVFLKNLTLGQR